MSTTARRGPSTWRNWSGSVEARPVRVERPGTEQDVVALVRRARAEGLRVKPVGARTSGTGLETPSSSTRASTCLTSRSTRGRNSTSANARRERASESSPSAAPST